MRLGGLLLHPSVVGIEGCLLACKDVRWLVGNYALTGCFSVGATQALLRLPQLRSRLNLNSIWLYLAVFQAVRLATFAWRLFFSGVGFAQKTGAGAGGRSDGDVATPGS